jgi:hypothetical protein
LKEEVGFAIIRLSIARKQAEENFEQMEIECALGFPDQLASFAINLSCVCSIS